MAEARHNPGRVPAIILAVLVHVAFIGVLVFGVDWQNHEPAPVVAELWNSLPKAETAPPPPPPPPEPEAPKPEPPKPEPKPEHKPEPKPEPKPSKADIALKKAEEEKRKKEEKLKEEKLREEKRKLEEDQKKKQREEQRKKDEREFRERLEREARQDEDLLKAQRAAETQRAQAAARASEMARYTGQIRDKIRSNIVMPPNVAGNPEAEFEITLIPTGEVINVRMQKSSGNAAYDGAVERAIRKSSPLPLPPADRGLFETFREQRLKFRPVE